MSFIGDIESIRSRARKKIEEGALTADYQLNTEEVVTLLNEALATELVCNLRYRFHYFMASGIHSAGIADEFLVHANEELDHADRIAKRIKQLGGKPEMNPAVISQVSHSEYKEGNTLQEMLQEDLIAERIAIETYGELVRYFGDKDPTSRRLMEDILAVEEEHADELADYLFALNQEGEAHRLYFNDEIPAPRVVTNSTAAAEQKVAAHKGR